MKRFYPLFLVVFLGTVLFTTVRSLHGNSQQTKTLNWRNDYRTLTPSEFRKQWGETFFNAVREGCDENLVCEWEHDFGHGTVESVGFFYGAQGCSCDTRYFPHHPVDGVVCSDDGLVIAEGGE